MSDQIRVYQAADSRWLVINNDIKSDYFNTESEATEMASKITFAQQAQNDATSLAQLADRLSNLETVYFDRGYNSGGSNPITNDDIASLGYTATDLASLVTLIQQFNNFLGNNAVTAGDYDATLNAIRSDV